ncbi:prolactin-releasing peptide receptor-like [Paramacrobiotus metropolitanus]|uniref:prolactin-releasing peptide receptor-like n=1 Tax=Paramacrobiotus metropolitanus TaxID=2943436 RepID=UPI002445D15E|nr:prolactin-releasing peptide receptor-like [Paramacrobiotus metropolitanus]XP_055333707.1 prolactin-releasing peptide receptor-like [Paramacrobiotus metropolitanus]XP_055333708.1 prolactin-releasing peptide receptor-like [Paramacrobiotus metropolitanus]
MSILYPDALADLDMSDQYTWELHMTILNSSGMNATNLFGNASGRMQAYEDDNLIHRPLVKGLICCLYAIIFVCGIFGNVLVTFVVIRNKAMHTVTNFFIASLAVNDIIICSLTVPLTPTYTFLDGWYFGAFMCHLLPLVTAASVFISTLTLTTIAVERYFCIVFPHLPRLATYKAVIIICSIWILSFSITSPYAHYMLYIPASVDGRTSARCDEHWPQYGRKLFGTVSLVVQYAIPLIVITFCYLCIWLKLRAQAAKGLTSSRKGRDTQALMRKRRTNRMLIAMVIIFGCCWLPLNLVNILNDYFPSTITGWRYFVLVFFLGHVIATSSTCYNPILYAWMNENFRKEFKAVLPCFTTPPRDNRYRQTSLGHDASLKASHVRNGTSVLLDTESTYMLESSPRLVKKVMQVHLSVHSNGSAGKHIVTHDTVSRSPEEGRRSPHLTVPIAAGYATLQVQDSLDERDGEIYHV